MAKKRKISIIKVLKQEVNACNRQNNNKMDYTIYTAISTIENKILILEDTIIRSNCADEEDIIKQVGIEAGAVRKQEHIFCEYLKDEDEMEDFFVNIGTQSQGGYVPGCLCSNVSHVDFYVFDENIEGVPLILYFNDGLWLARTIDPDGNEDEIDRDLYDTRDGAIKSTEQRGAA